MITSLAMIFLLGLLLAEAAQRLRLPRIVGMLAAGMLLGPYGLNLLEDGILAVSGELRRLALVIILLKAGLSLHVRDLKKQGRSALLLSFLPALCEILAFALFGSFFLGCTRAEAALLGTVMGAVSPAVVVPRMVQLMEEHYGTRKGIPQMILAGASLDDVFVIVLFSSALGWVGGSSTGAGELLRIPVSVVLGILLGIAAGWGLNRLFAQRTGNANVRTIVVLGTACLLLSVEGWAEKIVPLSGLLAVTAMACMLRERGAEETSDALASKLGALWQGAELLLFTLVGAAVNLPYTRAAGLPVIAMLFVGLAFRCAGTWLCVAGTKLNTKERLFCVLSYLPKATVQAAIGAVPLSMGLACGDLVLSAAVAAILVTAPLGAFAMDLSYPRLLDKETVDSAERI